MEPVEHGNDRLTQRRSAHNAVVDDNESIAVVVDYTVSHIVDMGGKIIAALSFGNESTQFYIFQRYFLDAQFLTA